MWCQWNGLCTGMLESILIFSAGYARQRNQYCYHLHCHNFPIQLHYWRYHQWELLKKKSMNQSMQLVMEWNWKLSFWRRLFGILICCALYNNCYTHLHLHLYYPNPHYHDHHYPFHYLIGWKSSNSFSTLSAEILILFDMVWLQIYYLYLPKRKNEA